jgi:membrane protease YdiL (CAAX protease family)
MRARCLAGRAAVLGGLVAVGAAVAVALLTGAVHPVDLGLGRPHSWPGTVAVAVGWLALLLAYSPLADALARRWFPERPNLTAFDPIRRSRTALVAGIVVAWVLGGFLEELALRGIVVQYLDRWLAPVLGAVPAATVAVLAAAAGAAVGHLYQGRRAGIVILQLSALLGVLMVVSGHNLWAVILCHGLYDTVAFIRYATGRSRYAPEKA